MKLPFKTRTTPEPLQDEPTRFFVHIPKTAGTSFRSTVESRFGRSRVLRDYGLDTEATSESIKEEVYRKQGNVGIKRAIKSDNAVLVAGHVIVTKYASQLGLPNTIAIFRDPVDQVISHYRHAVRHEDYRGDLISFARTKRAQNVQSRIMANIDPALLGIVGLVEKYRETLAIIEQCWGWNLRHKRRNVSGGLNIRPFVVSDEDKAEVERLNQPDRLLYARACHVFSNTWHSKQQGVGTDPRGAITRIEAGTELSGWALDTLSDSPLEVEILVNGNQRSRAICDLHVQELESWKLQRDGYVGFRTNKVTLKKNDCVEVRDANSGLTLASRVIKDSFERA